MSATNKTAEAFEANGLAHVNFRVRCDTLGHGEELYLVAETTTATTTTTTTAGTPRGMTPTSTNNNNNNNNTSFRPTFKSIALYTSPSQYPFYRTLTPLSLTLPRRALEDSATTAADTTTPNATTTSTGINTTQQQATAAAATSANANEASSRRKPIFAYRYAIFRAGVFHRWEQPSDATSKTTTNSSGTGKATETPSQQQELLQQNQQRSLCHEIPLHLLTNREHYIVNDVLGDITSNLSFHRVLPQQQQQQQRLATAPMDSTTTSSADTLHSTHTKKQTTSDAPSSDTSTGVTSISTDTASANTSTSPTTKKTTTSSSASGVVGGGFQPSFSTLHNKTAPAKPQTINLNSTDGLVVVSIFLPIILHRSPTTGQWSADWDYEVLLSMQTHLRVTRVGVVKWRSNNTNDNAHSNESSSGGVPKNEQHLVEECLRPFNCVPVWIDPILFGDMYNGFCKGVLWPVLHNVTSVYSQPPEDFLPTHEGDDGDNNANGENQRLGPETEMAVMPPDQTNGIRNHLLQPEQQLPHHQFSEYSMDDVGQGPIHGGRGHEAELWGAYNTVNRQFAEVVVQCFHEGDLIWIHGFHLLILPSYLTRRLPMAKVGIFLHTPFPSSEIFRTIWCREDLLRGMLNADQVGFHVFEYARHFLTSCRRLLGLNYGMIPDSSGGHTLAIDTSGRHVAVTSIHAGVEPPILRQILTHSITVEKAASIRNRFQGKHIFCAIDRLESLKGIPLKLLALERFLHRSPEWVGKIVLIQVGISAFERGDDYKRTKAEVATLVQRINATWPETVQFQECIESDMRLQQRMALLRAADVVVVTPIRDGLNLLPLEFTTAHQDALTEYGRKDGRKRGLCILSEFASCTRVMRGALHVNPWKLSEIANAFHVALSISEEERLRRINIASEFVTRVTTQRWALAVMLDLKGVHKNVNPEQISGAGLGLNYRLLGMETGFVSLDLSVVAKAYRKSWARLILLDYGGTIVRNDNIDNLRRFRMVKERSAPSEPTAEMIETLKALCADKRNTVFVVSGKERHSLTKTLGNIPNLGLAAEHGMFISWPTGRGASTSATTTTTGSSDVSGNSGIKRRWETLVPETDRTWRSLAMTIMEVYKSRTHGSYIEETEMKVLWQYRDADTEFGSLQAKELEDHLSKYLRSFHVDILHGGMEEGGYVEVRPKGVNKGVLAMRVIRHFHVFAQKERVDFSLVLGDDHCDEPMLSVMRQIGRRVASARRAQEGRDPLPDMPATIKLVDVSSCDNFVSPDLEVFTCTVGKKPSAAANYLHDVDEVQELLDGLVKISTRDQRYFSASDLSSMTISEGVPLEQPTISSFSPSILKSMSMDDMMQNKDGGLSSWGNSSGSAAVSTNLSDFLRLSTIEDDDDEEALTF